MGKVIVLDIIDLDIEQHSACEFDYLEIFSGPYADNSTSLGKYCGDFKPGRFTSFTSKHNVLLVHFTTDPSIFGRGFLANYTFVDVQCGGIISDERELIKPPMETDSSGFYQSNAKCQWLVFAPVGFVIQINVLNFELEQDNQCKYDFVKIFNNRSGGSEVIGPYCGTNIPKIITTTGNLATIQFQSDGSTAKDGFTLSFSFIEASKRKFLI
jgi:cubilin